MRFIDLFCGIGGFRLGLERTNNNRGFLQETAPKERIPKEHSKSEGRQTRFTCVWANDNDKYACQIYRKHWGSEELHEGDIRAVDVDTIPEHGLLCAGFPCQSFSVAGKRRGFEDTRGTLFFEICRVLRAKRPVYLLLENVKGLLSHDDGRTFQTILESLDELGYDCQWEVFNSKNFGVPQNRERVFIIGHLRGKPRPKVFPIGETDEMVNGQSTGRPSIQGEHSTAIHSRYNAGWRSHAQEQYISTAIDGSYFKGVDKHGERTMIMNIPHGWNDGLVKPLPNLRGEGDSAHNEMLLHKGNIRRLTPLECERLQGFPDGWTEGGIDKKGNEVGISDTQRYRALGNAVTVNVIEVIGVKL